MIKNLKIENCCGCEACGNICPKGAITFAPDKKGDMYPAVSKELCINCRLCEKVCPILNKTVNDNFISPEVFAAWNKNSEDRLNSTSGGIFSLFAKQNLQNGGYVSGVKYEDDFSLCHTIISKINDLPQIQKTSTRRVIITEYLPKSESY